MFFFLMFVSNLLTVFLYNVFISIFLYYNY